MDIMANVIAPTEIPSGRLDQRPHLGLLLRNEVRATVAVGARFGKARHRSAPLRLPGVSADTIAAPASTMIQHR